jgi:predicted dehydrogenase
MRCLVVGTGSIGARHARNLIAMGHEVSGWDERVESLDRARQAAPGLLAAAGLGPALASRPDAVLVCTSPASHVAVARQAVEAGSHVFIEKPIAHLSDEVPALLDSAKRAGRLVAVGFNLRFLPSLRRVKALLDAGRIGRVYSARAFFGYYLPVWRAGRDYKQNYAVSAAAGGGALLDAERIGRVYSARAFFGYYLPVWRAGRDYKQNYAVSAAAGGGALLDLIHDFDYPGWLFGEAAEVSCMAGHLSTLAGDTEDLAEVTVRFASGALVQVHVDYLRRAYRRDLEIIGSNGVITWDYASRAVTVLGPEPDRVERLDGSDDGPNEDMYVNELRHFVACLEGREELSVDGWEALRSLRLVEAAKRSAAERRRVSL